MFRKRMTGRANKRNFRSGYKKVVAKNAKGLPMMRGGGYIN